MQFLTVYQANTNLGLFECDGQRGEEQSGRPGVRNKEELGSRKKEREKDVERDQSLLPCQYSQRASSPPPPHLTTGEMER